MPCCCPLVRHLLPFHIHIIFVLKQAMFLWVSVPSYRPQDKWAAAKISPDRWCNFVLQSTKFFAFSSGGGLCESPPVKVSQAFWYVAPILFSVMWKLCKSTGFSFKDLGDFFKQLYAKEWIQITETWILLFFQNFFLDTGSEFLLNGFFYLRNLIIFFKICENICWWQHFQLFFLLTWLRQFILSWKVL